MNYAAIAIEGGLFPSDLLDRIAQGGDGFPGQRPEDFGLDRSQRLTEAMQAAFGEVRSQYQAFHLRRQRSRESSTTLTREHWVRPLLDVLGFHQLEFQRSSLTAGKRTYAISHLAGQAEDAPPVHIVDIDQDLDSAPDRGGKSPHSLVQEYLNNAEPLWGVVTNGRKLRILRESARFTRPSYLEFDLDRIVEDNLYSEFVLLYRLAHRTRFPHSSADAHECYLEKYYQQGICEGSRVKDRLRYQVEEALQILGSGFLAHPESGALRDALAYGQLNATAYYRQLLRFIYRLLFLFVAEERRILFDTASGDPSLRRIYEECYSVSALRERADRTQGDDLHSDLWQGLRTTFRIFRDDQTAAALGMTALDGELFGDAGCGDLDQAACSNATLLSAIRTLSWWNDDEGRGRRRRSVRRRVNYGQLNVEELGSVYEALLDLAPYVDVQGSPPRFALISGTERKSTGSYYTPAELVREVIESALVPVIQDRLRGVRQLEEAERALLGLRVVDPAAGSGHFRLAAARRIAHELARWRSGQEEPPPATFRQALRDVIRHCIYGVDKNPLAVDLCKVALWIESQTPGLPLSFLDHHIKCGDSLVGVFDLDVLDEGIPNGAYKPVTGDDPAVARAIRDRNRAQKAGQLELWSGGVPGGALERLAREASSLADLEERSADDYHTKEQIYREMREGELWWRLLSACHLWTAAFFAPLTKGSGDTVPTSADVRTALNQPKALHGLLVGQAFGLADRLRFFHWPLEFPEVFAAGGFDCVLGNPPWEELQPEEIKFFGAQGAIEIASLPGARRKQAIERLPTTNPRLAEAWRQEQRAIESAGKFLRESGRFQDSAVGKLNTYRLFTDLATDLTAPSGRAGMIVPTGLATDDSNKHLFARLIAQQRLCSLYDFQNREQIFPDVTSLIKFSLLTLTGADVRVPVMDFAFFLTRAEQLREAERHIALAPQDFALLNPNTRTCPIFRSARDAEITKGIYRRVPVLIDENDEEHGDRWGVSFMSMFHMSNDSHLFATAEELQKRGCALRGNVFVRGDERWLPLYEAKLIHQFDHRWATYRGPDDTKEIPEAAKADPACLVLPRYWVSASEVEARLRAKGWDRRWLLGWRDVARSTDVRTTIASVIPRVGCGNTFMLMLPGALQLVTGGLLMACLNSFVCDYAARQKVGGTHLTFHVFKQLPVLPPERFQRECPWSPKEGNLAGWIAPRVLELTYTAWDLRGFARDLGWDGPPFRWEPERRFLLRCELDAAFFHLYGIPRDDVDYIMDTFPIVRRNDEQAYGEYRTKRVILEIYDQMARAMATGQPYATRLSPPPADPAISHPDDPPEWAREE